MQDLEIVADKLGDVLEALEEDSRMAADPRMKTYHGYTVEEAEVLVTYMRNVLGIAATVVVSPKPSDQLYPSLGSLFGSACYIRHIMFNGDEAMHSHFKAGIKAGRAASRVEEGGSR